MKRVTVSARIALDIERAAKLRAAADRASLSSVIERALDMYLSAANDSARIEVIEAQAIAHEERIAKLESQQQAQSQGNRKGKRR